MGAYKYDKSPQSPMTPKRSSKSPTTLEKTPTKSTKIPSPKTSQKTSRKTSQKTSRLSSPKSPKITFQWNDYSRQVLCCLYRFFQFEQNELGRIFSEIFCFHLKLRGFAQEQIAYSALNAQWNWMKRNNNPVWLNVHRDTRFSKEREWESIINEIKTSASRLEILLTETEEVTKDTGVETEASEDLFSTERAMEDFVLSQSFLSNKINGNDQATDHQKVSPSTPPILTPATPISISHAPIISDTEDPSNCQLWGKPCFWCHKDGPPLPVEGAQHTDSETRADMSESSILHEQPSSKIQPSSIMHPFTESQGPENVNLLAHCSLEDVPPVLYRWSNIDSMGINSPTVIKAGRFAAIEPGSGIVLPEQLPENTFLELFRRHVTKTTILSPFISFFKGPLAPIHRGLRNGKNARIFIIETTKLSNKTFKAAPLVEPTGTETPTWKGYGEYLVWNEVSEPAIASTFTIAELEQIVSEHSDIAAFLQLYRIKNRQYCSRFLRYDLAKNVSESDDGYTSLLEKFTDLLGVPEYLRRAVATGFIHAWLTFRGLEYEAPDIGESEVDEPELPDSPEFEKIQSLLAQAYSSTTMQQQQQQQQQQRVYTPSEASYEPSNDRESDHSRASSSTGSRESEEVEERPRRHDTPSSGFSVQDSSSDDREETPIPEADLDQGNTMESNGEEAYSDDLERIVDQRVRWPSRMFARGRIAMWNADIV